MLLFPDDGIVSGQTGSPRVLIPAFSFRIHSSNSSFFTWQKYASVVVSGFVSSKEILDQSKKMREIF